MMHQIVPFQQADVAAIRPFPQVLVLGHRAAPDPLQSAPPLTGMRPPT